MLTRRVLSSLCLLALLTSACNRNQKRTIGMVPKGRTHVFWQSVHAGAVKAARERGVEINWNGPSNETDFAGQLQIVDSMISRRESAIALAPIDKKAMVSPVERAMKSNIPVVIFDSGIDTEQFVSQVATDNYHAGEVAAERMGKVLNGKGKVAIVAVQVGGASTMAREQGFEDYVKKNLPGIQIVDKRYGMADVAQSLKVAENMLTAYPDLNGMFGSNESSTMGATQALKGRASKVKCIGFDWSPTFKADIESGVLDSVVVQNPFRMGYEAVIAAVDKLDGKSVTKINNLEPRLVEKADLGKPEIQELLSPDLSKWLN